MASGMSIFLTWPTSGDAGSGSKASKSGCSSAVTASCKPASSNPCPYWTGFLVFNVSLKNLLMLANSPCRTAHLFHSIYHHVHRSLLRGQAVLRAIRSRVLVQNRYRLGGYGLPRGFPSGFRFVSVPLRVNVRI